MTNKKRFIKGESFVIARRFGSCFFENGLIFEQKGGTDLCHAKCQINSKTFTAYTDMLGVEFALTVSFEDLDFDEMI